MNQRVEFSIIKTHMVHFNRKRKKEKGKEKGKEKERKEKEKEKRRNLLKNITS